MKVIRVLIYEGDPGWVTATMEHCFVKRKKTFKGEECYIEELHIDPANEGALREMAQK